ncbi:cleavage stimulation factor subunit 2 tau variant isoform X2 [Ischnura elegans]|uniref:cleavage stimulation factor subunit 2 tau variant isoform X2 n=1 Tax=Ischnura elegans TaxID=197161 RepID=UPI001ED880DF|nr:cleavage stimulation factor subunit 2 tau variant isoform X2 [Ischnura elegans]
MADQSLMDKSLRSVFVGNIPYEATEEKLKDIFSEVGPVLSFKLVYDRETGKPKGYGFCEYKDQETALSAMRNLNGYEIGGRTLRVDNACTEKSRMEMQSLLQGPVVENPYGDPVAPEKAPEAISKAVASLPPEQMYELMKQMRLCIQNNPTEAHQMLLQNPQLAYALLQALVVMKVLDPHTAASMLHKAPPAQTALYLPPEKAAAVTASSTVPIPTTIAPVPAPVPLPVRAPAVVPQPPRPVIGVPPVSLTAPAVPPVPAPARIPAAAQDLDLRQMDPRAILMDQDLRSLHPVPVAALPVAPPIVPPVALRDPREREVPTEHFPRDPRNAAAIAPDRFPVRDPRPQASPAYVEPRSDPRSKAAVPPPAPREPVTPAGPTRPIMPSSIAAGGATDQEKAALIMQVLQLSDDQISMLPPEQRQSILVLKEQIAKSTQR